jgi:hypothetical protein
MDVAHQQDRRLLFEIKGRFKSGADEHDRATSFSAMEKRSGAVVGEFIVVVLP